MRLATIVTVQILSLLLTGCIPGKFVYIEDVRIVDDELMVILRESFALEKISLSMSHGGRSEYFYYRDKYELGIIDLNTISDHSPAQLKRQLVATSANPSIGSPRFFDNNIVWKFYSKHCTRVDISNLDGVTPSTLECIDDQYYDTKNNIEYGAILSECTSLPEVESLKNSHFANARSFIPDFVQRKRMTDGIHIYEVIDWDKAAEKIKGSKLEGLTGRSIAIINTINSEAQCYYSQKNSGTWISAIGLAHNKPVMIVYVDSHQDKPTVSGNYKRIWTTTIKVESLIDDETYTASGVTSSRAVPKIVYDHGSLKHWNADQGYLVYPAYTDLKLSHLAIVNYIKNRKILVKIN